MAFALNVLSAFTAGSLGILATMICSRWLDLGGEPLQAKGIGFIVAGVTLSMCDLLRRSLVKNCGGIQRYFLSTAGGHLYVPYWALGGVLIFGGVTLLFTKS